MKKFIINLNNRTIAIIVISAIIIIDQIVKILIKTNMTLGEDIHVFGNWFIIHFTENAGMAFGLSFGGDIGKYLLTIFRIVVVVLIIWYLLKLLKQEKVPKGVIIGISAFIAGALGNTIDSVFYGVLFSSSHWGQVAEFLSAEGGYSTWFQGHVVDMFYFPIIDTHLPSWFPIAPNKHIIFFRPVFNVADSFVTCSAVYLIFFQRRFFGSLQHAKKEKIKN